jgi:hypothetical protein
VVLSAAVWEALCLCPAATCEALLPGHAWLTAPTLAAAAALLLLTLLFHPTPLAPLRLLACRCCLPMPAASQHPPSLLPDHGCCCAFAAADTTPIHPQPPPPLRGAHAHLSQP